MGCELTCCLLVRLTDPEILERRYPVILNRFSLAPGSGGEGKFRGGEGVLRQAKQNNLPKNISNFVLRILYCPC